MKKVFAFFIFVFGFNANASEGFSFVKTFEQKNSQLYSGDIAALTTLCVTGAGFIANQVYKFSSLVDFVKDYRAKKEAQKKLDTEKNQGTIYALEVADERCKADLTKVGKSFLIDLLLAIAAGAGAALIFDPTSTKTVYTITQ